MEAQKNKWLKQLKARNLADEANRGFVDLAAMLMRVINGQRPIIKNEKNKSDGPAKGAKRAAPRTSARRQAVLDALSIDPEVLNELAKKVDSMLEKIEPLMGVGARRTGDKGFVDSDELAQKKLKDLFHQDAWRRSAAARWIRENRCSEAILALEGVLQIEESEEVREEIVRALSALSPKKPGRKGDGRCSRSSAASL